MLLEGRPVTLLASDLGVTPSTIRTYVSHIMEKLGVDRVAGVVRYAFAAGLVEPGTLELAACRAV